MQTISEEEREEKQVKGVIFLTIVEENFPNLKKEMPLKVQENIT